MEYSSRVTVWRRGLVLLFGLALSFGLGFGLAHFGSRAEAQEKPDTGVVLDHARYVVVSVEDEYITLMAETDDSDMPNMELENVYFPPGIKRKDEVEVTVKVERQGVGD